MEKIYFDNAATTPLDPEVKEVMIQVMTEDFGNPSSIHHYGRKTRALIEEARKTVANTFNASIGEIFFTSSATEANNTILKCAALHMNIEEIISSPTEHHCIIHTLEYLQKNSNTNVIFLDVDERGNPDLAQLASLLKNEKKQLVSLMFANNEIGTITDIAKVSELCQEYGALLHSDIVQAIGKFDIDFSTLHLSFASGSAHKFYGPKGAGFFYMNNENIIPPFVHGGAQERNMRAGTENVYGIVGLAKALELAYANKETNYNHLLSLRNHFKQRLENEFVDIKFNGNQEENYLPNVLNVSFPATEGADMLMFNLDISGICASSGSACSSGIEEGSHVLTAIKHDAERKAIRFSFGKFNTLEEIDTVVEKLKAFTPTV